MSYGVGTRRRFPPQSTHSRAGTSAGRWGRRGFGRRAVLGCRCWTASSQRHLPTSRQRYSPKGLQGANGRSSVGAGLLRSSWGASSSTQGSPGTSPGAGDGSTLPARAAILGSAARSSRLTDALHHPCLGAGPHRLPDTRQIHLQVPSCLQPLSSG